VGEKSSGKGEGRGDRKLNFEKELSGANRGGVQEKHGMRKVPKLSREIISKLKKGITSWEKRRERCKNASS